MTCQNCGAPVRLDREQGVMICDYCRSQCAPPADEDGVTVLDRSERVCPACQQPLFSGRIETRDLLYCTTCHGMLVGMDELMPLLEQLRAHRDRPAAFLAPRDAGESERVLRCPLCTHEMDRHPYGGGGNVMVDSCEDCSQLWLDRGELRKIVVAPDPEPVYSNYGHMGRLDRDHR